MTFRNLNMGRVTRAVLIVSVIGSFLSLGTCYCFLTSELMALVDPDADLNSQQQTLQDEAMDLTQRIYENPPSDLNIMFLIQLGITLLVAFWQAHWAAIRTDEPRQAMNHALAVGTGVLFTYGILLFLFAPMLMSIKALFYMGLLGVSVAAGRVAGGKIARGDVLPASGMAYRGPRPALSARPSAAPVGGNVEVFYEMGVSAAMGGRREEAREHFTRVLQMQPRHVPAWLQLANLSDTPEQAWSYILQARAISPNDPDVQKAERVIWPKVAANARRKPGESEDAGEPASEDEYPSEDDVLNRPPDVPPSA